MSDFTGLNLAQPIQRAILEEGYDTPTPIQAQSIPVFLKGRDLLGVAQTGTGKTAAFSLPLLHRLANSIAEKSTGDKQFKIGPGQPMALILAPTRELAVQIGASMNTYGRFLPTRCTVVFGGAPIRQQIKALARGVHILVATPGRLVDLMNQGHIKLHQVEVFVLDEADRMLDMGFIHTVKQLAGKLPKNRQTVMFSATMPKQVQGLAAGLLSDPVKVEVAPAATTAERVEQRMFFLPKEKKRLLLEELLQNPDMSRVLIFTRTKHNADRVTKHLIASGVRTAAIHGNKAQNARQRALKGFRAGNVRALVATDIAARGIDVEGVTHVINFELPNDPDSYVHRIGRTARGGAAGIAISFCDPTERDYLRGIERTIRQTVPVIDDHPYHLGAIVGDPGPARKKGRGAKKSGGGNRFGSAQKSGGKKFGGPKRGNNSNSNRNGRWHAADGLRNENEGRSDARSDGQRKKSNGRRSETSGRAGAAGEDRRAGQANFDRGAKSGRPNAGKANGNRAKAGGSGRSAQRNSAPGGQNNSGGGFKKRNSSGGRPNAKRGAPRAAA